MTHLNKNNNPTMVDISEKTITSRVAIASGEIHMQKETIKAIKENKTKKGAVLHTAIIAAISASKKTYELIPMCHNILIESVNIDIEEIENGFKIISTAKTSSKTGIEMEALTAVNIGLLTIYDMVKAIDKKMVITNIKLEYKSGGKSDK